MPMIPRVKSKMSSLAIVSVGRDALLLGRRKHALEALGLNVICLTPEQAEPLAHDPRPRLWVFCGTIEASTLVYLACAIRRHSPESRLLLVEHETAAGIESSLFHRVVGEDAEATPLAEAVQEMSLAA